MNARHRLAVYLRESRLLRSSLRVLEWDQDVWMPAPGGAIRADQLSVLAGISHERDTGDELGELLEAADGDDPMVREAKWDFDRRRRVPKELAQERVKKTSLARQAWTDARKADDFSLFRPHLESIVDLIRRWADAIGYEDDPYDALVEDYEPGETTASLDALLEPVRENSANLLARVLESGREIGDSLLRRPHPIGAQRELGRFTAEAVGFDFARGRLDETAHPFCSGFSPNDVRLTTRYDEGFVFDSLYSTLHEAGHGIYEQGLPESEYGNPLGEANGMALHESQSRMIENHVTRSRACWEWLHPHVLRFFPEAAAGTTADDYYAASNIVRPNLIRVDADEVTYDLHVVIRYELEKNMLSGDLAVADLPGAWNELYRKYLHIDPPSDADGCLQDVHWSAALFGYFPTYSMGNVYAAQIFAAAERDLGDLAAQFARGEFTPLKEWLNEKIHRHGRRYPARELMEKATGAAPSAAPMIEYLDRKFAALYEL
ncbi:MAG: carboxypeptidase M32 [Planctomycetota bacterium]|jgi:carboxypeptidase Taq